MRRFIRALAIAGAMLAPAWASADDQQIAQQIAGSLRSSGQLVDYSIGVKYENGTAWLLGRVASEEQRDRAIAMARKLPSVTDVVSKLEIKSSRATASTGASAVQFAGAGNSSNGSPNSSAKVVFPENSMSRQGGQQGEISQTAAEGTPQAGSPSGATATTRKTASSAGAMPRRPAQVKQLADTDPGDPLAQTAPPRFSSATSRLFSAEPLGVVANKGQAAQAGGPQNGSPAADPRRMAMRGNSQVAQAQAMQAIEGEGMQMNMPQGMPMNMQQGGPQYRMASNGGAFQAQPVQAPPGVSPAGYHYPRGVPNYGGPMPSGPSMAGCQGGACNGPAMEQPNMPGYAWPSYAAYPNYGAVTYPRQYSPTAWPYIGPFYPYPQVPLGWRKVALEWDDGWWWLDFYDTHHHH